MLGLREGNIWFGHDLCINALCVPTKAYVAAMFSQGMHTGDVCQEHWEDDSLLVVLRVSWSGSLQCVTALHASNVVVQERILLLGRIVPDQQNNKAYDSHNKPHFANGGS